MFTINDFFNLMSYFKTGSTKINNSTADIDSNLIVLAEDSKAKTTLLFNDTIDLSCHVTDDYKRLKNFLVPWYASIRTFNSTMSSATDVRSLPESQLNTLLNSFGFVDGLTKITKSNKVDFFYDLVNLYKIKGSPECIGRVLNYFGFGNLELFEYWLQYDENRQLVFRPQKIINVPGYDLAADDVQFTNMISLDPHWFLSADQINQLFLENKIAFPSKSPYFGIRPILYLQDGLSGVMGLYILYRIIQDAYYGIGDPKYRQEDYLLEYLRVQTSVLNLYLSITYLMNLLVPRTNDSDDPMFFCYNGELMSETRTYEDIVDEYNQLVWRKNNQTSSQRTINEILFQANYLRPTSTDFLQPGNSAGAILAVRDANLKNTIDAYYSLGKGPELLSYLLTDLANWMKQNISIACIDIASLIVGFSSIQYIKEVINFFKPYRARYILGENAYIFKDALHDTVLCEDRIFNLTLREQFLDWDTANSISCCSDATACLFYSRDTYDCGSEFDRGASDDKQGIDPEMFITHNEYDHYNYHTDGEWLMQAENDPLIITEDERYLIAVDKYETYISNNYRGCLDGATPTFESSQPINITGVVLSDPSGPVGTYDLVYDSTAHTLVWFNGAPVTIVDSTAAESYILCGDETSNTIIATVEDFSYLPNTDQTDSIIISYGTPYVGDSTRYYHLQDGGPVSFDNGGVFDAPAISDVCEIYVCPVP